MMLGFLNGGELGGLLSSGLVPILLVFIVFYFLLIRPTQQQQKQQQAMLAAIKRGDKVVTNGGLLGTVQRVRDAELDLEIAQNVRVVVMRDMVNKVVKPIPANDTRPVSKVS